MKKIPNILESELFVLKILWKESPLSAKKVIDKLEQNTSWKPKQY